MMRIDNGFSRLAGIAPPRLWRVLAIGLAAALSSAQSLPPPGTPACAMPPPFPGAPPPPPCPLTRPLPLGYQCHCNGPDGARVPGRVVVPPPPRSGAFHGEQRGAAPGAGRAERLDARRPTH
jgi:hypothetical protein